MPKKILMALGLAAFALAAPAVADGGSTPDTSRPLLMAQQNMNPTNDPDVQRGINERNEQERQRKIQECFNQRTAQMNPPPSGADAAHIRGECEHGVMSSGIRG